MTPNPTRRVLSTLKAWNVRALLAGGQACVLYGAAEFSRDSDFLILADARNLRRLRSALRELQAAPVYFPPLTLRHLRAGHGCHFRCRHPEADGFRVDILARMRGLEPFERLWRRRTALRFPDGTPVDALSVEDLVRSKKTQRDKDWPMIRRLVETDFLNAGRSPGSRRVAWWLAECRTPSILAGLVRRHPALAVRSPDRPWLRRTGADEAAIAARLREEEDRIRAADCLYWQPLRRQLEAMRLGRRKMATPRPRRA
ncbi:MAG: hypothetical protein AAB215_05385 [Planctomycetota bacterium]